MSQTMRAATTSSLFSGSQLTVDEAKVPKPGAHDVLVKVHASSVNPKDWKLNTNISGLIPGVMRPHIIGDDLSGVVVECGAKVTDFAVGDEVYGMDMRLRTAACAEYAVIATKRVAHKPKNISHAEAAVVPLAALTALQAYQKADLAEGQHVLIIGASGGVGTFGVQIAKAMGAEVTGVCSGRNIELVRSLGADAVIDYTTGPYLSDPELAGAFDMVFDATSYETPRSASAVLKADGVFMTTGGHGGALTGTMRAWLTPGGKRAMGVVVESYTHDLDTLREMIEAGEVRVIIDSEFTLDDIAGAYARSKSGRSRGKIAIHIV